jgi:hypothetical protein
VESKWKNYHIITFPGQSLSKTLEEAMDLSQDRLILELEIKEVEMSGTLTGTKDSYKILVEKYKHLV